jgi:DNA polymerase-3 subunit delta
MTYEQILSDIRNGSYHPVYFLHGEEPYYIDRLAEAFETKVLTESEKEFNQSVLYGKDLDVLSLLSVAKRYPMMSSYQVVIVKEAQDIRNLIPKSEAGKERDPLLEYLQHPLPSTLLVFCYKYKKLDKRTRLYKALSKSGVLFESARLYDNKLPEWITGYARSHKRTIDPKAAALLAEYLGNDLEKISNEVDKLVLNLKDKEEITTLHIEEFIGISRDYNIFELHNALGKKNILKANQIVNYFTANPKNNPLIVTIPQLFSYFMKVLTVHTLSDQSPRSVASSLGVNPYFVQDYVTAARAYPQPHVLRIISTLREYDTKAKGVDRGSATEGDLLKELVYKILH